MSNRSDTPLPSAACVRSIAAAKQDPNGWAGRILPTLLFGDDSAYGQLTTEAAVQSIDRKDVERFHSRWFHPNNATLVVTSDADLAEIRPLVEIGRAHV